MPAAEYALYPDDLPKKSREPEPRLEESRRKELQVEKNQDVDRPARDGMRTRRPSRKSN